jgi:hypothetical protein
MGAPAGADDVAEGTLDRRGHESAGEAGQTRVIAPWWPHHVRMCRNILGIDTRDTMRYSGCNV